MPVSTSAADPASTEALVREDGRDPDDVSIGTLIGDAVADGRSLVAAEIELGKARLAERIGAYKGAIVFLAAAAVLALAALVALLVGSILSIATLIGPGLATAAVVLATLTIAAVLALIGKGRLAPPKPAKGTTR